MAEPTSQPPPFGLLDAVLEFASDFLLVADAEGKPIVFNRAYAAIIKEALGVEMRPGLQPHKLLPDPEAVAYWDGLHARVLGGEAFTIELAQRIGDEERHFSFSFSPIVRDDRVTGFCEMSREITERVRAQEALRESERLLRESQAVARIGSYRFDITRDHWTASATLDEIFGVDADFERTVASWTRLVHPDYREAMVRYFEDEVLARTHRFDREYPIVRPADGAERWVHGLGRLELDEAGIPRVMVGTIRDITERRALQDRLRQQEKLEAIGQLAGGVAHDFNNQLVSILGFAELLRGRVAHDSQLTEFAAGIITGAGRAADLTEQLLAFSRKGKHRSVPVDLHRILAEVINVLERTISPRVSIVQRLLAPSAVTVGDPTQLQNALLNLGLNARDAQPAGGRIVFATSRQVLDADACGRLPGDLGPGDYVVVEVADSGPGIPREHLRRVFEPFFTTKGVGQGTGMGLASVYGAAQSHHGGVTVESEPGRGATFRLYLPHVRGESASDPPGPPPGPAAASELRSRAAHVLLIDDDAQVRKATSAMLEHCGFRVTPCVDGLEAVDRFRAHEHEFDVVLLDMVMPGLSGAEAFAALHALDPEVRAIVASGYSQAKEVQALAARGVRQILQKPYRLAELVDAIEAALAGR